MLFRSDYVELDERREREPLRQRRYLDEEDDGRFGLRREVGEAPRPPERPDSYELERSRELEAGSYPSSRGGSENERYGREQAAPEPVRSDQDWRRTPSDRISDQPSGPWRGRGYGDDPDDRRLQERPLPPERSPSRSLASFDDNEGSPASVPRRPPLDAPPLRTPPAPRDRDIRPVDVDAEPLDDPW